MDKIDIIKKCTPDILIEKFNKIQTIENAIQSNQKTLSFYKKQYNREYVINYINLWIISLNEFITVNKMTPNQIKETSNYIYNDYYYLNLADIYLIFTKIKKGEFGQIYGSIDGLKILTFFQKYASDRANICENNSIIESDKIKYQESKQGFLRKDLKFWQRKFFK